jgi:signal transduction histidine kinase
MWLEVGKVPVTDNSGNVNGVIAFAMDVTTRVNLEEQLRQTTKMESIGRLAGGIAHDFNNILGGIIGASELIRRKAAAQDIRTINDIILEAAGRASDLVKRLLVFARQESHTDSPLNLHRVIENTLTLIGTLLAPRFTIRKELHAEIDRILGDPAEMQSALINIMCNARDAMPDGGTIDISTRNRFIEPSQDTFSHLMPEKMGLYIELSITDHGTGMTAETASRMFDPFYTTKSIGRGTGLGLATVYGSLKQHGGAIDVSSAPGRGTAANCFRRFAPGCPICRC